MNELNINYEGISSTKKIANIVTGVYLAAFTLYFTVTEGIAGRFGLFFFCAIIGFILAAILILSNTVWLQGSIIKIDTGSIISALPKQSKVTIDWTSVSRVNIGMSYIVFLINGEKKQRRLDLVTLRYEDVLATKAKIVEICEYKNIPYQND